MPSLNITVKYQPELKQTDLVEARQVFQWQRSVWRSAAFRLLSLTQWNSPVGRENKFSPCSEIQSFEKRSLNRKPKSEGIIWTRLAGTWCCAQLCSLSNVGWWTQGAQTDMEIPGLMPNWLCSGWETSDRHFYCYSHIFVLLLYHVFLSFSTSNLKYPEKSKTEWEGKL